MTCSSATPLFLNTFYEFENTDDDKTPEYPLSDDHPLSLTNRSKLLNAFKSSPKYQIETTSSVQTDTSPNQTNTIVNQSGPDDHRINGDHIACGLQQPRSTDCTVKCHSHSPCDILQGTMSDERLKQDEQKRNKKRVTEALDLASGPDSGSTNAKAHHFKQGISLQVRSLTDFFGGHGITKSYETNQSNFTNIPEKLNKNQEFYSVSSTDSNNNSGRPSLKSPKEKTEKNISTFQCDTSKPMPISLIGHTKIKSVEFTIDTKDNTPPHLSPVIDAISKSDASINSQGPTFPPILSPLIADAACISLSLEHSSVKNKIIQSQSSKCPIQRETMVSGTNRKIADNSTEEKGMSSLNVVNLERTSGLNFLPNALDDLLVEVRENGCKKTCNDYPDQIPKWKENEVPKLSSEKADVRKFSNCLSSHEDGGKIQAHSPSRPFICSELDGVPSKKWPDITFSVHSDKLERSHGPSKPKKVKKETVPAIEKKEASQTFLSTEAKSVTSSEITLCYPYSTKTSLGNRILTTKESEPRLSAVPRSPTIVCNRIDQTKMPLKEHQSYSINPDNLASRNVPKTFESSPIKLLTPSTSLTSPLSSIALSVLPDGDLPTLAKSGSVSAQFPSIAESENCHLHAPHNERVLGPVATSTGHVGAIDFFASLHNSKFPSKVPKLQAQNTVLNNNKEQKRQNHKSYYVFAEWSGPSSANMDWLKQENILPLSNKFDPHGSPIVDPKKIQGSGSDQTTWRDSLLETEFTQSITRQESCKMAVNSLWENPKVQCPSDISLKSNQANDYAAHQIPTLRENGIIKHDNLNSLRKDESKRTDLHGLSSSLRVGTGQSEPLDLSSKHFTLHSTTPRPQEVMVKSMAKISPFVRFLEHANGKDSVFEHKKRNMMTSTLNCELANVNPNLGKANKLLSSVLLVESDQLVKNSERDHEKYEPRAPSGSSSTQQHKETDELSLPNEPKLVIDLEDNQMEHSPSKSLHVKENMKGLPVDNYSSLNPVEKSYSHLAFAAITSKKKKSLASCMIPSENEDFLDFLRRGASNSHLKKGKKSDSSLFSRLRNGEFIDLTEDKEDVLSVSSDGTVENTSELYEPENLTDDKKDNSSPHVDIYKAMSISAMGNCTSRSEDINHGIGPNGSLHYGVAENTYEMMRLKDSLLPGMESCYPKISCNEAAKTEEDGHYPTWHRNLPAVFDDSKLSFMKQQSLTFSPPQKARMAKRIQDIISRNSKLLPECMQHPSSNPTANISNLSETSNLLKSEAGHSNPSSRKVGPSNPNCTDSLHDFQNSFPQHIKVKRSLSLESAQAANGCEKPLPKDTALRCSSVKEGHQNSCLYLPPTDVEGETAQSRVSIKDELNQEEPSPYKTVWQTQFFTGNSSCVLGDNDRDIAGGTFPATINNEELVQRLELMHDASNSLNQVSHTNMARGSNSGEVSNQERKRLQKFATDIFHQPEYSSDEMYIDALSDRHSQMDNEHILPSASGQLNQFIPSTFVVAPYYAMAYPLCYPALQGANAPNQPILLSHHNGSLNVVEGRACRAKGRKRTKKPKPDGRPRRKKSRKASRTNNPLTENTTQDKSNELPKSPLLALSETYLDPIQVTETAADSVQTCVTAQIHDSVNLNSQRSTNLQIPESTGHHSNNQDPMASDCCSYLLQTQKEDGLTILSMQYAGQYKSSDNDETKSNNQSDKFCNFIQNRSFTDHNSFKSCSTSLDSPGAKSWDFNILDTPTSSHSVNVDNAVGQNLATLALASEAHKKIQTPAFFQLMTAEKMSADLNSTRMNSYSKASNLEVNETYGSLEKNAGSDSQTQMLHTFPVVKECQESQERTMMHGITEKEKLVTEMLATMMQNRNLTSEEKSSEWENADSF